MTAQTPERRPPGDLSMGDLQDPFLVSIHIIADPGQARTLQRAADQVLSWLHPELTLFRVSERAAGPPRRSKLRLDAPSPQPALAVILFLQEDYGGEENQERLHGHLRRPPWRYHHTERVNGRGLLPLSSASQDFFTLAPGTPLWALRQVHYGKEIVRFTIYCRHETYSEQVQLYRLLMRRRLAQRKEDFCFCVVFSNRDTEIQLSFKRLPRGQKPTPTECAIMEIRVRDVGGLVPLLPHPCTPISDIRWQTEDYDGNRILLQVQGSWKQHRHTIAHFSRIPADSSPIPCPPTSEPPHCPPSYGRGPASYRNRRHRTSSRSRSQNASSPCAPRASLTSLPLLCEQEDLEGVQDSSEDVMPRWMGLRSRSTFSLPTEGFGSGCVSPSAPRPRSLSSLAAPVFRINVDALVGAEETDVDTGQAVSSSSVDLSVVSAYSHPQMRAPSKAYVLQPVSTPLQDGGPGFMTLSDDKTYLSLKRHPIPPRTSSISSRSMNSSVHEPLAKNTGASQGQGHVAPDAEQHQSNGTETTDVCRDGAEEDEQEFYI
ncbi:protein FAM124A isoform X2 [Pygocentrus nattereri]|uniref:protein FAM124A isoform X2 n=1 Tax=Pygocentrus nattereri TaxID=42514 RepID=UPI0018912388|nr:protein FAM124A isoform X2 [Pygocentrus nattereri]